MIHILLVFVVHLGHIGTAAHFHGDQAFGGQHLERLAQGGAADAVFLGNAQFVNPAAGCQFARKNALPQEFGDFFVQGAGGQGDGGHGVNCKLR